MPHGNKSRPVRGVVSPHMTSTDAFSGLSVQVSFPPLQLSFDTPSSIFA